MKIIAFILVMVILVLIVSYLNGFHNLNDKHTEIEEDIKPPKK